MIQHRPGIAPRLDALVLLLAHAADLRIGVRLGEERHSTLGVGELAGHLDHRLGRVLPGAVAVDGDDALQERIAGGKGLVGGGEQGVGGVVPVVAHVPRVGTLLGQSPGGGWSLQR